MESRIFSLIRNEEERQESTINLIASENYASKAVLAASGSVLTNKYAEGYPGKRYYGGCEVVDEVEDYARDLGKKLFGAEHINVQPHSGASANFGVYLNLLNPGDTVVGMSLAAGGHLTHGYKANFSGKIYNFVPYGVNQETEQLDYEEIETIVQQHKPKMLIAGASAYARLMDYERLAKIAHNADALLMVDMAHLAGLVAAKVIPSPIPWADVVSSTTHKTLRGPRGGMICSTQALASTIDKAIMPGTQGGPLMHVIAAKAVAFEEAMHDSFTRYSAQIIKNAKIMAQTFTDLGYRIVSGGTDTHLMLIDLRHAGVTGKEVEELLGTCNIIVNRNAIPFDTQSPLITSGIRIGTPAITTRNMGELESERIAVLIDEAIRNRNNARILGHIKTKVSELCGSFPIYPTRFDHHAPALTSASML
jgi:glycine hydroxymethyltransferase